MKLSLVVAVGLIAAAGCSLSARVGPGPDAGTGADSGLRSCTGRAFTPPAATGFTHTGSRVLAQAGARHSAQDVIAPPGPATDLVAKLSYGPTWKDLQDEQVAVYVDDCAGWVELGTVITSSDGVARAPLGRPLEVGVHEVRFVVLGDATQARAALWVLPVGTHLVISDIDGTLTSSDSELFREILDGRHVPVPYPSSAELTRAHVGRGHVVVYLTGRPTWLIDQTRAWLGDLAFASGPLRLADSNTEILPTEGSVGAYKAAWIRQLLAAGYVIDLAYGNATTDIYAYTEAGIPATSQWIIGPNGGEGGTIAVADSWAVRTVEVAAGPRVVQPF